MNRYIHKHGLIWDVLRRSHVTALAAIAQGGIQGGEGDGDGGAGTGAGDGAGSSGGDPGAGTGAPPAAKGPSGVDWEARGKAAENKAAKLEAEKRERDGKNRKKKEADDLAAKEAAGNYDAAKKDYEAKLKAQADELNSFREAAATRLETKIKALPEAAQKEIELVRESLSTTKLEELVELKASAGAPPASGDPAPGAEDGGSGDNPPPAPGVSNGGKSRNPVVGHQLNAQTHELLDLVYPGMENREIGKHLGRYKVGDGYKWRYKGTGNDTKDTNSFISLNSAISNDPMRARREAARKRINDMLGAG